MTLGVRRDSPLPTDGRAALAHQGQAFHDGPRSASRALTTWLQDRLHETWPGGHPRQAQFGMSSSEFFERLTRLRRALLRSPEALQLARKLLEADGWPPEQIYFDRLRLRAVGSGTHLEPEAAAAYHVHRDTWYANPPAQLNLWIAIYDVDEREAFGFWPQAFETAVRNSSAAFDYAAWQSQGGWQTPHPDKVYPCVEQAPPGPLVRHGCPEGGTLLFSGSQLHGTLGHDSGRTRFSAEIRFVRLGDVLDVQPRRNLDNRSRGTTLPEMSRLSDGTSFPPDVAEAHARWSATRAAETTPRERR